MSVAAGTEAQDVRLSVPARADYLVLARLALAAVCRLTPLGPDDVIDLKLAVTEAATGVLGEEDEDATLDFVFALAGDRLVLEVSGDDSGALDPEEWELSRAIIEATVDEFSAVGGRVRLVKLLSPRDPE